MPLKKEIGKTALLFLVINAILGAGIFFLPAIGASLAGPASIVSWLLMSAVAILMASYFAELVSMFPKAGSIYEYNKNAFGEFPSFVIGWLVWIITNIAIAMLIVGALYYLLPGMSFYYYIALSAVVISAFSYLNYRGVKQSTTVLMLFGIVTLLVLLSVIIPGAFFTAPENYAPFAPFGFFPVVLAMFFIFEAFAGWESTCFFAEEIKNARKILPKVLVYATLIIVAVALLLAVVSIGTAGWQQLGSAQAPMAYVASVIYGSSAARLLGMVMFIPLIGSVAAWIIASPRLLFAMSRDKVLPKRFSVLSKYGTPANAILFQMFTTIIITVVGFGNYMLLLSMLLPLSIISYSSVLLSFLKLRISRPKLRRYFSAPFPFAGPVIILLFNASMLVYWLASVEGAFRLFFLDIILLFFGIPLYFLIKLQTSERFTEKFFNAFSPWDRLFPLWYGKKETQRVLSKLRLKKGQRVLDFGCGSGITTLALAKAVGQKGEIVAVDISRKQLERTGRKITKTRGLSNIIRVKEKTMPFRKGSFDAVTAVCVLGHLGNPEPAIRKMMSMLKKGGRYSFMEFGRALGVPAPGFLREEKIRKIFLRTGASVNIRRERRNLTEYWYIWGEKL